jgi:hypothetical protein
MSSISTSNPIILMPSNSNSKSESGQKSEREPRKSYVHNSDEPILLLKRRINFFSILNCMRLVKELRVRHLFLNFACDEQATQSKAQRRQFFHQTSETVKSALPVVNLVDK